MKLYEVGCIVKEVQPKNGVKITLEEAQALVGGYVELVHLDDNNILLFAKFLPCYFTYPSIALTV